MSTNLTVMKMIEAIESRNIEMVGNLLSDEIIFENIPEQNVINDKKAVIQRFNDFFNIATSIHWDIKNKVIDAEIAIIERVAQIVINNRYIRIPMITVMAVKDNKITVFRDYFDSLSFSKQLES